MGYEDKSRIRGCDEGFEEGDAQQHGAAQGAEENVWGTGQKKEKVKVGVGQHQQMFCIPVQKEDLDHLQISR